jgi:hypothetical protein
MPEAGSNPSLLPSLKKDLRYPARPRHGNHAKSTIYGKVSRIFPLFWCVSRIPTAPGLAFQFSPAPALPAAKWPAAPPPGLRGHDRGLYQQQKMNNQLRHHI